MRGEWRWTRALAVNDVLPLEERRNLAAALNTLLASPTFASWREGTSLDVREWLTPKNGRTPAVIVSVGHLDDEERTLVLGVLLEELLAYTRSLPGSRRLKALLVFDEVYGLLPPHPQSPPTKRPTVALMKQGRAFGMGVVVATQNPWTSTTARSRKRASGLSAGYRPTPTASASSTASRAPTKRAARRRRSTTSSGGWGRVGFW